MIGAALGEILLRQAPPLLRTGLASGELQIFGSVIREASTGRIAGFLQEAAPLPDLLQAAGGLLPGVAGGADVLQGQAMLAGIGRIEDAVGAVRGLVQVGLGLDAVGIGVTVAGFAVLSARIDGLRREIGGLGEKLDDIGGRIEHLRQDLVDVDLVGVAALAKSFDEAWALSAEAGARRWHEVAGAALACQGRFEMRAARILSRGAGEADTAGPFLDAVSLASALRVASLAACDEVAAAQAAAADGARSIERMTGAVGLVDLAKAGRRTSRAVPGTGGWALAQARANLTAAAATRRLRRREVAAHTRAAALPALGAHGLTPRRWLEAARAETECGLLFLPSA